MAAEKSEGELLGAIIRGLFVGATLGIIVKFVTDKQNLKYAGTGAVIGATAFGILYYVKSKK